MTDTTSVLTERSGGVLTVTLNRPERLNAISPAMADAVGAALYDLGDARCVVITGAGKGFCSGADIAMHGEGGGAQGGGTHRALQNHYHPLVSQILHLPVPVVAAVNGAAAGIGCALALAADFTLAARSAYFLQAFVNIGLVPDGGSSWLLARAVGRARAAQMMMLGEKIAADQAEAWGLVYKAVADEALAGEAQALAARLAAGPTLAYATMKRNLATALDGGVGAVFLAEAEGQARAAASHDAREGGLAFLQKRPPAFRGA